MKLFLKTIVLSLILISSVCAAFAQKQDDTNTASFSKVPYRIGEKLTYSISFANFPDAAFAELYVAGRGTYFNREGIELRANVQTSGQIIALYSINDDYISYIDPENGKPYRTQKVARSDTNPQDVSREYNQPAGDPAVPSRSSMILGDYDFLSALYRLRALPLTQGATYRFTARNNDETTYDVELQVRGTKSIKTKVGSFNTIITLVRVNKRKADAYNIKIYFGDDDRHVHVPVLITVQHPAGEIRAELASFELPQPQTPNTKEPVATKTPQAANNPGNPANRNPANPATNDPRQQVFAPQTNPTTTNGDPTRQPNPNETAPGIPKNPTAIQVNPNARTTGPPANGIPVGPISGKNNPKTIDPQPKPFPKDVPFAANEQLNFSIFWQNSQQPVGKVSFQVSQRRNYSGRDGLMLLAKADSAIGAIAKLFNTDDTYTSYINPESLLPYRSEIKQSNNHFNQTLTFDQDTGKVSMEKGGRVSIPVGTHDLLSLAYALRLFDLTPNKGTRVNVFVENDAYILTFTSLQREVIELGGQSVNAVQLKITVDDPRTNSDNASADKFSLRLWVSDDPHRWPLRFSAKLPDGTLRADLAIVPTDKQ